MARYLNPVEFLKRFFGGSSTPSKSQRASKSWWYFYYEPARRPGAKPKEMSGPFATKAQADAKARGEIDQYGRESGARYVVRQLTTKQAERVWGGPVG